MFERSGFFGIGFYFLLDFVSTISLIPDTNLMSITDASGGQGDNEALKAGRASKASKATRVIRLVRLVRMVRFFWTSLHRPFVN